MFIFNIVTQNGRPILDASLRHSGQSAVATRTVSRGISPGCSDAFGKPCSSKHVAHSLQSRGFRYGIVRANSRLWWRTKGFSTANPETFWLLGSSWVLLEDQFLAIKKGRVKRFHKSLQHVLLIHSGKKFYTFIEEMNVTPWWDNLLWRRKCDGLPAPTKLTSRDFWA